MTWNRFLAFVSIQQHRIYDGRLVLLKTRLHISFRRFFSNSTVTYTMCGHLYSAVYRSVIL